MLFVHQLSDVPSLNPGFLFADNDVWNFIGADFDCCRLMTGLCSGTPGGWTAWPSHEHVARREEVYVYRMVAEKAGDRNFMDPTSQEIYGDKYE